MGALLVPLMLILTCSVLVANVALFMGSSLLILCVLGMWAMLKMVEYEKE